MARSEVAPALDQGASARTIRISQINGLRAFAIVLVLLQHAFQSLQHAQVEHLKDRHLSIGEFLDSLWLFYSSSPSGWVGVNIFFVLSGFVLFYPYALGKREMKTPYDVTFFLRRRARRLLPLLFISSLVIVSLKPGQEAYGAMWELSTVLTLTFPIINWLPHFNPPLWTVGLEIYFSVLLPLLIYLGARFGLLRMFSVVLVVALAFRIVGTHMQFENGINNPLKDSVFARLDDFVLGMVLCNAFVGGFRPKMATLWVIVGIALIYVGTIPVSLASYSRRGMVDFELLTPYLPLSHALGNNVIQLGIALVVMGSLAARGVILAILNFWPIQVIGIMTYSLYIWHMPIMRAFDDHQGLVYSLAILAVLTPLSHRFIEFYYDTDLRRIFGLRGSKPA